MAVDMADARIRVRIGETVFHTTKATLIPSQLFASLFSLPEPADGEYFVDGDPELFTHILRHLRTKTYPIFYDNVSGHDIPLYAAVRQQAEFYQLSDLAAWLSEKKYLKVIRKAHKHFSHTFVGKEQMANMNSYWGRDEQLQILVCNKTTKKEYQCPAMEWRHHGAIGKSQCMRERCYLKVKGSVPMSGVQQSALEVEGVLTSVEIFEDLLRLEQVDSSGVVVAAMAQPPPYAEGEVARPTTAGEESSSRGESSVF
ncbi:hypothetical protein LIA77_01610 [Sarocladium implicatum]|nr:hypothetical protein LIA77_01610 [Sarocladium implicatum]